MAVTNLEYMNNISNRIANTTTCEDLAAYSAAIENSFNAIIDDSAANVISLNALEILPAGDINQVVIWIAAFKALNITKPLADAVALNANYTAQLASLQAEITAKAATIEGCSL